ncbi:predicted protein [Uncinocarpus reesii 1704]|uniref:Uncharacterized protein n=1 Tax=Uncinocarpus reesii (strain UAMH 1704) TaxID=336963 RepID=C4JUI3_UNCRE|nr:uncharacterized protein UREG_04786 [Uncinocarpus reesii 1704]EEP79944.1 predicted protein [Uncinocarpus reesii 1704]
MPPSTQTYHDPQAESLKAILARTTRTPIFCHPKAWSRVHLDILRVSGLDQTHPLDHVIGKPVADNPSAHVLRDEPEETTTPEEPDSMLLQGFEEGLKENDGQKPGELDIAHLCICWIEVLRNYPGNYPHQSAKDMLGRRSISRLELQLRFENRGASLKGPHVLYDALNNEYPPTYFPIIAVLAVDHESYRPRSTTNKVQENIRLKRWRKRSQPAELAAILLAMAQQQAQLLAKRLNNEKDPRFDTVHPIVVTVKETVVRFVRAHVSLRYLDALTDPTRILKESLVMEMSEPLDMLAEPDRLRFLPAATGVLDQYFADLWPILSKRKESNVDG